MKVLLHGLQTSGSSYVTFILSQKPDSLSVIDLGVGLKAPRFLFSKRDIVLKCVINTKVSLATQQRRFGANKVGLVLRNPYLNYQKLIAKPYANLFGSIEEKFSLLEQIYIGGDYDSVLLYEDALVSPQKFIESAKPLEFGVNDTFFEFRRSAKDILEENRRASAWFRKPGRWGFGNIHFDTDSQRYDYTRSEGSICAKAELVEVPEIPQETREIVRGLAPAICRLYDEQYPQYC